MKKQSSGSAKNDFVMPILVLSLICLVITALLALTNSATEPVITQAALERAEAARTEIIPEADGFELMEVEGLPGTVKEVYKTTNDEGYIFMLTTMGYGGEMDLILGMNNDGTIIEVNTLKHSETKGMGSKTTEEPFRSQFVGKDKSLEGVDAITGATISSTAYLKAVEDAFEAFDIVTGNAPADADAAPADEADTQTDAPADEAVEEHAFAGAERRAL